MDQPHSVRERRWLGRYELIGEIASGGMASVFLARLAGVGGFQRLYAVKRLHDHLADDRELVRMFLDEARVAACLHHPSVVPITEVGEHNGTYFLVMPYVEGDSVAGVMNKLGGYAPDRTGGPMPIPIVVRIVLDTLAGLHAAHELVDPSGAAIGLVHRDCSPQNILVGVDGCARIIDFGVARATHRITRTGSGLLKGKLAYMAPEQVRSDRDLDRRCDIFAMGIVLWELLSGRRLFKSESELATLGAVLEHPVPSLRAFALGVPEVLEAVCLRALQRDRDLRYATAVEMASALEAAAQVIASASSERAIASSREVADYVVDVLGSDLAERRKAVRAWLARPSADAEAPQSAAEAAAHLAAVDDAVEGTPTKPDRASLPPPSGSQTPHNWSTPPIVLGRRQPLRTDRRFGLMVGGGAALLGIAAVVAIGLGAPTKVSLATPGLGAHLTALGHAAPAAAGGEARPMSVSDLVDGNDRRGHSAGVSRAARTDPRSPAASRSAPPPAGGAPRPSSPEPSSADLVNPYR